MSGAAVVVISLAALPLVPILSLLYLRVILLVFGRWLRSTTEIRRQAVVIQSHRDRKAFAQKAAAGKNLNGIKSETSSRILQPDEWSGIVGFFHPFCNAGGGGERVLWAAIAATQQKYPKAVCAVYTGDHEIERLAMVTKVKQRFDITLEASTLHFVYLSTRDWVYPSTWPYFTLLGQSIGSLVLVGEAFSLMVPDIFIDTMGYAFAVCLSRFLFPKVPCAAYVHYPTISTDMLESLDDTTGTKGIHSGKGSGFKGRIKKFYWRVFAWMYGWVGRRIDFVMCNSSWTAGHITQLWNRKDGPKKAIVLYPPCPVSQLKRQIEVSRNTEKHREKIFLYIAQFRHEKNHSMIMSAFAKYYHSMPKSDIPPRLVLIGSVRRNSYDEKHVYKLRLDARALGINDNTEFLIDASFDTIMVHLRKANVSVNGMYSEHFGIGNVEGMAAGLILVCHNSGGPKLDICLPLNGKPTGFLAENEDEYANAFAKISKMSQDEVVAMRLRARESAERFSDEIFADRWIEQLDKMVGLWKKKNERAK